MQSVLLQVVLLLGISMAQVPSETPQSLYDVAMKHILSTPPNYAAGLKPLQESAGRGFAKAQTTLGELYQGGLGVKRDGGEAIKWFLRAANQDDLRAQTLLANAYANGLGVKPDDKEALKWLRRVADQSVPSAQVMLGSFYAQGRAVERNPATALEWYRKAAGQNLPTAQLAMGSAYENGLGGFELSLDEAAAWYRKAAAQGLDAARAALQRIEPDIASTATPVQMDRDVARKNLVSQARPRYPDAAKAQRVGGRVLMETIISTTGRVRSLKIQDGHPLFNEAAMTAARQWRYQPQTAEGQPVQILTLIEINFAIY